MTINCWGEGDDTLLLYHITPGAQILSESRDLARARAQFTADGISPGSFIVEDDTVTVAGTLYVCRRRPLLLALSF